MASIRQDKLSSVLRRELAELFLRNSASWCKSAMVTITKVRSSPDLGYAKVYLSVFAVQDKQQVIDSINRFSPEIRRLLGQRIRNQVRRIPEIIFFLDDSLDYEQRIDELLKK